MAEYTQPMDNLHPWQQDAVKAVFDRTTGPAVQFGSSVGHSVAAAMSHLHAENYRKQLLDRAVSNAFGGVPRAYLVKDKPFKFVPSYGYGMPIIRSPFLYTADIGGSDPVVEPEKPSAFLTADLPERLPPEVLNDDKSTLVILGVVALLILLLGVAV